MTSHSEDDELASGFAPEAETPSIQVHWITFEAINRLREAGIKYQQAERSLNLPQGAISKYSSGRVEPRIGVIHEILRMTGCEISIRGPEDFGT